MEGIISQLIDAKVLQELEDLNRKLGESASATLKWLDELEKVERSLKDVTSFKEYIDKINEMTTAQKNLNKETEKRFKTDKQIADLLKTVAEQANKLSDANKNIAKSQEQIADLQDRLSKVMKIQSQATDSATSKYVSQNNILDKSREKHRLLVESLNENRKTTNELEVELKKLQDEYNRLNDYQKGSSDGQELKGSIHGITEEIKHLNGERKDLVKSIETEQKYITMNEGSLAQLRVELSRLTKEYDGMSKSMRDSAGGQELRKQIKGLSDDLKKLETDTGRAQRGVGEYERGIGKLTKTLGINLKSLTAVGLALMALKGIKEGFKKVVSSTSDAQDRFNIAMEGAKSGVNYFWQSLSSGNFDHFTGGLMNAIRAGAEYKTLMIELEARTRSLATAEAEKNRDVAKLRAEAADSELPEDIRLEKLEEAKKKETEFLEVQKGHVKELLETEVGFHAQRQKMNGEELLAFVNQYHEREEEIKALKEIVVLEDKINEAKRGIKYGGQSGSVYATQMIAAYSSELDEMRGKHAEITDKNISDWRKYGNVTTEVRDKIAKEQQEVYRIEEEYDTKTRRMITQISNLRKEVGTERIKSEKNMIDIVNIRLQAEADALKKVSADERKSLDVRLEAYMGLAGKQKQILRGNAGVAVKEAAGDADKIALIHAKLNDDLRKLDEGYDDFKESEALKLMDRITSARQEVIEIEIGAEMEKIKKIADNEKAGLDERIEAQQKYTDERIAQMERASAREKELLGRKGDSGDAEILELEAKTQAEIAKITEESAAQQLKIVMTGTEKQIEERRKSLEREEAKELATLSDRYAKRLVTAEEYEKEKKKIHEKYVVDSSNVETDATIEYLNNLKAILGAMKSMGIDIDTTEIENKIIGLQYRLVELKTVSNEATGKMADEHKNLWEKWASDFAEMLGGERRNMEQFSRDISGTFKGIGDLIAAQSAARVQAFDEELKMLDEKQKEEQKALDNSIMGDERRALEKKKLDLQQEAARKAIEDKKRAEQQRQAQFEKRWSIAQIGLNTAMAIMKTAASVGFPAAIPLIIAAAALGAVQTAVAVSTPIPSYEKGTEDHPGGFAVVGEKRHEAVITPKGKIYKTPKRPTLVSLEKGTVVKPDFDAYVREQTREIAIAAGGRAGEWDKWDGMEMKELIDGVGRVERAVLGQKGSSVAVHLDRQGFFHSMEHEGRRTRYLNYEVHKGW